MGILSGILGVVSGVLGMDEGEGLKRMSMRAMAEENPFGPYRDKYAKMLGDFMDNPAKFLDSPLYTAAFDQGSQAVMRGFAGEGLIGSGNMATGLQGFGMSMAFDALNKEKQFLAGLAGADQNPDFSAALHGRQKGAEMRGDAFNDLASGITSIFG